MPFTVQTPLNDSICPACINPRLFAPTPCLGYLPTTSTSDGDARTFDVQAKHLPTVTMAGMRRSANWDELRLVTTMSSIHPPTMSASDRTVVPHDKNRPGLRAPTTNRAVIRRPVAKTVSSSNVRIPTFSAFAPTQSPSRTA